MKRYIALLVALTLLVSSCSLKDAIQEKTREILGGGSAPSATSGSSGGSGGDNATGASAKPATGYDEEFTINVGKKDDWKPFGSKKGFDWENADDSVLEVKASGAKISFEGLKVGDSEIIATLDGVEAKALVHVRDPKAKGESTWTIRFDEATNLNMMGLASVDYDLDMTVSHSGPDMFGEYAGEIGMEYAADLSGLGSLMAASGVAMDYDTDGWFKNTEFKLEIMPYTSEKEDEFAETLKDPNVSEEERALVNSVMGSMFAGVGGGEKDFETSNSPVGLWYDWAFHANEGDMSAYVNMNSAMFSVSATQNETASYAEASGYAVLVGPLHADQSYADATPFPYTIEVYESGEAVFTLRAIESPITVKFYGTITKE